MLPTLDYSQSFHPCSKSYSNSGHELLNFDRLCNVCSLECTEAVGGCGPDDLSKVKLIFISDYPGGLETQYGFPQCPITYHEQRLNKKKREVLLFRNSGQLIRELIPGLFDLCSWSEVYMTNVVKCQPTYKNRNINITEKRHIYPCLDKWFKKEWELFEEYCPNVPIIVAGSTAIKGMFRMFPELYSQVTLIKEPTLKDLRRLKNIKLKNHNIAFTFNPAQLSKLEPREIKSTSINRKTFAMTVTKTEAWTSYPMGSPYWNFIKDINWLREHIN